MTTFKQLEKLARQHGRIVLVIESDVEGEDTEYILGTQISSFTEWDRAGQGETIDEALEDFLERLEGTPENESEDEKS